MQARFNNVEFEKIKELLIIYEWGQRILLTKLNIIQEDLKNFHDNNPIEYIKGRMKSPVSIAEKLHRLQMELTAESAQKNLYDIAGIRVICPFARDIFCLAKILKSLPETRVITEKDYIAKPKPSGYRSYHIILSIPVYYSGKTTEIPVEVQIRTEAMNFWATLEHKARYKYKDVLPQYLVDELVSCADKISELDGVMFTIHEYIFMLNK